MNVFQKASTWNYTHSLIFPHQLFLEIIKLSILFWLKSVIVSKHLITLLPNRINFYITTFLVKWIIIQLFWMFECTDFLVLGKSSRIGSIVSRIDYFLHRYVQWLSDKYLCVSAFCRFHDFVSRTRKEPQNRNITTIIEFERIQN